MNIVSELFIALALCAVGAGLVFAAARALYRRDAGDGAALFTVVAVSGSAEQLEQTLNALLHREGTRVLIADCGLAPEPRRLAELFARDNPRVTVCEPTEIPRLVTSRV
jgi:xanthine/CO dehydrogenase XdhC/CoxF family maturation factor